MQNLWEDNLLEKKVESDLKDLLKTIVAFSNTVRPEHKAVILIGEKDDGSVQGVTDPDNIQKMIRRNADKVYPPVLWKSFIYEKEGKTCVRIEIEHSGNVPHFSGGAYVRKGSESVIASEQIFQQLIDTRTGKVFELSKWINKIVSIMGDDASVPPPIMRSGPLSGLTNRIYMHRWDRSEVAKLVFVNSHWVTLGRTDNSERISEPLSKLTLSYDDENDRLKIIVAY